MLNLLISLLAFVQTAGSQAHSPGAARVFQDCTSCPEMVILPKGTFLMGSPVGEGYENEHPQHAVEIASQVAIGRFEVTFAEWDACVADGGCNGYRPNSLGWGRGRRPVVNISWDDATAYANWLSVKTGRRYRLPSEAEWEFAARAGSNERYYWGKYPSCQFGNLDEAICRPMGLATTDRWRSSAPVGQFPPNRYGLYDMFGNVSELVNDCYSENYVEHSADNTAASAEECSARIVRGAGFSDAPTLARSAQRVRLAWGRRGIYGFRVIRDVLVDE